VVIGVSPDSVKKHCNFKEKHELPYTLVADTDHAVSEAYGVWQEKSMFGHKYMGIARTTFLIAPGGRIAHVFDKVTPIGHATEVLAELTRLRG
jgi:thioredoxin-dependent peroxiredoxin